MSMDAETKAALEFFNTKWDVTTDVANIVKTIINKNLRDLFTVSVNL
jgi:hypothetical protein